MSDRVELTDEQKARQVEVTRQIIDKINTEERVELVTLRAEVKALRALRTDIADLRLERDDLLRQASDARRDCVVANTRLDQCLALLRRIYDPSQCSFDHHGTCQNHLGGEAPCVNAEIEKLLKHTPLERIPGLGGLPPEKRTIRPLLEGWEPRTYYIADVSVNRSNPIWRGIFYSGFLDEKGRPAGYNGVFSGSTEDRTPLEFLHYLRVLSVIEGVGGDL